MNQNHAMSHSSSLRRLAAVLCGSLLLLGCTRSIVVPEPTAPGGVEPVQTRISDPVIAADLAFIESLRTRMQRLNEEGRPIDDYHLCKAQAWTDLAYEEYTDNDRSRVIEGALEQATFLIQRMEAKDPAITLDTPVVTGAKRVREDLWVYAAEMKARGLPKRRCAACCSLAKMEVQTVDVGHEYLNWGWRGAESAVMAAERLQREVKGGAAACFDEPAAPPANCPVCQAATPAPVLLPVGTTVSAPAAVHFGYDRTDISPATASELARVAQLMAAYPDARLRLTGFADLRDGKGNRHNEYLARERAAQAQRQLLAQGIAASRLTTAIGQTQGAEVANGPQRNSLVRRARAMERRVELVFDGIPGLVAENQLRDLQPDR